MSVRAITGALCALALCAASGANAKPWVTAWFPFEVTNNRIHVPIKIAGAEATAILDTGSNGAFIERVIAEAHGVRVSGGTERSKHAAR